MAEETYTHGHHESVLRAHRWRTAENSAAYLLPHLRADMQLLDVGCGPGTITVDLARAVAPGRVVGIDAAAGVLDDARAEATAVRVDVSFATGDAYALDAADGTFDVVHAHQVLQHLNRPVEALREWSRVCRPDGLIAARDGDYGAFAWYPELPLLERWRELYRTAARANGGEPDAGRKLVSWAHAAGLRDVHPSATVWCFATPEDRAWWGGLWAERISSSKLAGQLQAEHGVSTDELAAIADAWRTWATDPDGWCIVPSGEILARPGTVS